MTYWNLTFLVLFLPLTIIIYNILPQKHRWKVLLIASYIFFWSISGKLLIYLLAATFLVHDFGLWFMANQNERDLKLKNAEKEKKKEIKEYYLSKERKGLLLTILLLGGTLVLLKYSKFLGTNINSLFDMLNLPIQLKISKFLVPIGISFYTLQAISYIMDVYKGKIEADKSLGRLALYLSFFPQIMEGPICRYSETAESLWRGERTTYKNLTFGLQRMLFGIMKKMVIADRLNLFIIEVFTNYAKYDGGIVFARNDFIYTSALYGFFRNNGYSTWNRRNLWS